MGICGTGMAALAGMLKANGYHVTGSDANIYPPMSVFLAQTGIPVYSGYSPDNLIPRPDLVIVGNVVTRKNPEAVALVDCRLPYVSFPQALNHYFLSGKTSLVIAGTHGKTTTSSLLATLLHKAGLNPGFLIGGLLQDFGRNYHIGTGQYFVVEGDEYDTAFFDKGPKFLHYNPHIAVITSIEFDHADIYRDLDAVKQSFKRLVKIMPANGCLIACLDDPVVRETVKDAQCEVQGYGLQENAKWVLTDLQVDISGTSFSIYREGELFGKFMNPMPGRHNALNALAVIALLDHIGIRQAAVRKDLETFKGVKRRQEVRGIVRGITVIDDFAHHPTSVRETLAALKAAYKGHRLLAVFEPRTNSSRRAVFQKDYTLSFDNADLVIVKEPIALPNILQTERFSAPQLVTDLCERGIVAHYFPATDDILDYLERAAGKGDVIVILSNGGFDNIHQRLLERLATTAPSCGPMVGETPPC